METKNEIRSKLLNQFALSDTNLRGTGKLAEKIRSLDSYRSAECVYIPPTPFFQQIRLNCLIDRKTIIVPDKSLKKGFFTINPRSILFKDFTRAASAHGLPKFGRLLGIDEISGLNIELMLTGAVAVDQGGGRLGSGKGFLDLSYALLGELGGFLKQPAVIAVIDEEQLFKEALPLDIWDVQMSGIVSLDSARSPEKISQITPRIFWKDLPMKRIRKISMLWQLFQKGKAENKENIRVAES